MPGYEAEQQDEEADTGAGIEAMRAGGIVRMADGGEVDLPMPPPPTPGPGGVNMQDMMQRNMALIPGIPEELMNRLREGRTNEPERRREAQSNALVEAGLRIAASNNPRLAGAIGEGALPAVQGYTQQRAQIRQDQRADLQSEMAAAQADIQRRYMAGQLSAAEYRSAMSEAGANERLRLQLAQQAAQQGATQGAAESRFTRELAAQREARMARGEFTPQEYEAMSPERRALAAQIRETNRPRSADVTGYASLISGIRPQIADLRKQLNELGPRPPETTGFLGRPNPMFAEWEQRRQSLQDELNPLLRLQETASSAIVAPRGGAARAGTTAPQAAPPAFNYVPGTGLVPNQ